MIISTFRIGLALAFLLLPTLPAESAQKYCVAKVGERLDHLNVSPSDISGISYDAQINRGRNSDRLVRILAWVSLHSCKGYLIVDLSPRCRVNQVYGRGECDLGGTVEPW
jgi:hypothetical protein